jgi:hypothetical protein
MIYKFKSKAGSDVLMMGPHGDELLRALGRQSAAQGIIASADIPAAIDSLNKEIARQEALSAPSTQTGNTTSSETDTTADTDEAPSHGISLRQRAWPLFALLRLAHAENQVVIWGQEMKPP